MDEDTVHRTDHGRQKPSTRRGSLRCGVCGKRFNGEGAGKHMVETGHNDWELTLPKQ